MGCALRLERRQRAIHQCRQAKAGPDASAAARAGSSGPLRGIVRLRLQERQQFGVDLVRVDDAHPVRRSGDDLEPGVLDDPGR